MNNETNSLSREVNLSLSEKYNKETIMRVRTLKLILNIEKVFIEGCMPYIDKDGDDMQIYNECIKRLKRYLNELKHDKNGLKLVKKLIKEYGLDEEIMLHTENILEYLTQKDLNIDSLTTQMMEVARQSLNGITYLPKEIEKDCIHEYNGMILSHIKEIDKAVK